MLKADILLRHIRNIKPGMYVTWCVYNGKDVLDAKLVENYVTPFFRTGNIMPIPNLKLGLNIHSVETEYDDVNSTHKVEIEGIITKLNHI